MKTVREMIREGIESGELSEDFIKEITQKHPESFEQDGITIWRATIDSKRQMNCVECEEDDQCIATQTPIAVKVYFLSKHPAFRKSLGANVEAHCERCGKIHVYDINHWEICGAPVQGSEQSTRDDNG